MHVFSILSQVRLAGNSFLLGAHIEVSCCVRRPDLIHVFFDTMILAQKAMSHICTGVNAWLSDYTQCCHEVLFHYRSRWSVLCTLYNIIQYDIIVACRSQKPCTKKHSRIAPPSWLSKRVPFTHLSGTYTGSIRFNAL